MTGRIHIISHSFMSNKTRSAASRRKSKLNKIFQSKTYFEQDPYFQMKEVPRQGSYEVRSLNEIRAKIKGGEIFLEVSEKWQDGKKISFQYKVKTTSVSCSAENHANGAKYCGEYMFRYEEHIEGSMGHHLHVMDNIPPHFLVKNIEIEDLLNLIETDFI